MTDHDLAAWLVNDVADADHLLYRWSAASQKNIPSASALTRPVPTPRAATSRQIPAKMAKRY